MLGENPRRAAGKYTHRRSARWRAPKRVAATARLAGQGDAGCGAPPQRVFIIDGGAVSRQALQLLLQDEGFTVEADPGGPVALARMIAFEPDVLLIDVPLSARDSLFIGASARAWRSTLPIVFMSGIELWTADLIARVGTPPMAWVPKPIELAQLFAAMGQLLAPVHGDRTTCGLS